jgi:hypothetical protein
LSYEGRERVKEVFEVLFVCGESLSNIQERAERRNLLVPCRNPFGL